MVVMPSPRWSKRERERGAKGKKLAFKFEMRGKICEFRDPMSAWFKSGLLPSAPDELQLTDK